MGLMERLGVLSLLVLIARAETVPSSGPVPPLQWIRLNTQNQAPALAYATAGFDYTNNQLIIFGGETSGGLPYGNTHLLDISTMTWTTPNPSTATTTKPPPRSRAAYGHDIIASYRNGFVIFGGQGQNGQLLSDVWEYAFTGQFWYKLTVDGDIPSPRYGAVGGGDPPSVANSDTNLHTTFWMTGGITELNQNPEAANYDDIYQLSISGTVAQNIQDAKGTWTKTRSSPSRNMKHSKVGQASLVMRTSEGQAVIGAYGGCDNTTTAALACVGQDIHTMSTTDGQWGDINSCPSARLGAAFAPNYNPLFTGQQFGNQAFLLFGLTPNTNTTDTDRLDHKGEIDVLTVSQGVWSRVIPSCDPSANPPCPVPREGAAVVSSSKSMVGSPSSTSSDIIIFGGKDKDGNVLNDAWLLRAITAQVTYSNQTDWGALYGNGGLASGVNANGQGVTIEYLLECSQAPPNGSSSSSGNPSNNGGTGTPGGGNNNNNFSSPPPYTTSTGHKALAAVSVLVILASVLSSRLGPPSKEDSRVSKVLTNGKVTIVSGVVAWAIGVAGLALSFTSIQATDSNLSKRSDKSTTKFLPTDHAIAGFILFLLAYVAAPLIIIFRRKVYPKRTPPNDPKSEAYLSPPLHHEEPSSREKTPIQHHLGSTSTPPHSDIEEDDGEPTGAGKPVRLNIRRTPAPSAFFRDQLWPGKWGKSGKRERLSSQPDPPQRRPSEALSSEERGENATDGEASPETGGGETGFVVLNRGKRALERRMPPSDEHRLHSSHKSLGEMSWLERRRHMNTISDLDYAMSRMPPSSNSYSQSPLTPPNSTTAPLVASRTGPRHGFPRWDTILLHCLFHLLLLALCVFTVQAIFSRSGKLGTALGVIFVLLVVLFYVLVVVLAFRRQPSKTPSILVTAATRLRGSEDSNADASRGRLGENQSVADSRTLAGETHSSPMLGFNTLQTRPLMHTRYSADTNDRPGAQDDDDDEGERIEREMGRRDVSIVTVPKRRLFIANTDPAQ